MELKMNKELMLYALADAEKFWRHKRREVRTGECELYNGCIVRVGCIVVVQWS